MSRTGEELPMVYLRAGEMYWTDEPKLVVTVLGSCLSAVFHSRRKGISGICHGIHPTCGNMDRCNQGCHERFAYVDCSIRQMAKLFDRLGCRRSEIDVKCFGGADIFPRPVEMPGLLSVGRKNSASAQETMMREGLTPSIWDVGGRRGRKIFLYAHTGEVLLKRLAGAREAGETALRTGQLPDRAPGAHRGYVQWP